MLEITEEVALLEELPETEAMCGGHDGHEASCLITCLLITGVV